MKNQSGKPQSAFIRMLPSSIQRRIEHHPELVKILENIGWLFSDKILRMGIGLFVGVWVARYLGPEKFGQIAYIISLTSVFQVVTTLGLDNIAIREISKHPIKTEIILGSIFRLRIFSSIFCYVSALAMASMLNQNNTETLTLAFIIAGTILLQPADTIDIWFQTQLQSKRTVLAKNAAYLLSSGIKLSLIALSMPILYFASSILAESVIGACALYFSYKKFQTREKWKWDSLIAKNILKESFPFFASGLMLTLYTQIDKLFIENIIGSADVGFYVAAASLISAFTFLPVVFFMSLAPKSSKIESNEERIEFFIKATSLALWLGLIISISLFLASGELMFLLYGGAYTPSETILRVLALSLPFIFISVANDYYALSIKKGRITLFRTLTGLLVNISLNLLLTPKFGTLGASISCVAAHIVSNTFAYWVIAPESYRIFLKALLLPFSIRKVIQ